MLRVSLRNLLAHRLRLALSTVAVVLGVAFVAGSLVFTDTLRFAFDGIVAGGIPDVTVQPAGLEPGDPSAGAVGAPTVPASLLPALEALDGVARVDGGVSGGGVNLVDAAGDLVGGQGAPTIALSWSDAPSLTGEPSVSVAQGRPPARTGEVVLDVRSAQVAGYAVGDEVTLLTAGAVPELTAELVGTADFAGGGLAGATLVLLDTATAQDLLLGGEDVFSSVSLTAAAGVTQRALADEAAAVLPPGLEAVPGDELAAESQEVVGRVLGFLSTLLLVFAGIAVVVGTFLVVNTFSMLVAQRSRELALLRALGASRRQVVRAVLVEAGVVGVVGSTAGLAVGVGLAVGLQAVFGRVGLDLSGTPLVVVPRTAVVAYAVGVPVTVVAAYLPARRAGRIPPVAAMRDEVALPEGSVRRRLVVGALLAGLGAVAVVAGLGGAGAVPVGAGALGVLVGVSLAVPVLGRPLLVVLGAGYARAFGAVGQMAGRNALRNPRRTAATASALMIGLALVSTMSVLGSSLDRSIEAGAQSRFTTDFLVSGAFLGPFSTVVGDRVADVDGVADVLRVQSLRVPLDGRTTAVDGVDPGQAVDVHGLTATSGSITPGAGQVALSDSGSQTLGARAGDEVVAGFAGGDVTLTVSGTYADSEAVAAALVPLRVLADAGVPRQDSTLWVVADDGLDGAGLAALGGALRAALDSQPSLTVQDRQEFVDAQRAQVDQVLFLVYALLGLAVVIAVLGVVNTLALSVVERTREVGLLRAVGLSRRQLRTMVRLEAVAISVLGAVLGVLLGLLSGVVLQRSVADDGIGELAVPGGQLAGLVLAAAVLGVVAAGLPARRAARLDVLRAISTP